MYREKKKLFLAAPRGFCAGVQRAVQIVQEALEKFGRPVYVRHEIVHNQHVVEELRQKGAIFVEELSAIPEGFPVIFSAHGVSQAVVAEAKARGMTFVDATCPLVQKVHAEAAHYHKRGFHLILIGHAGHPEVEGTMGQIPPGSCVLLEKQEEVKTLEVPAGKPLMYLTQTTLSVQDVAGIVEALKVRFPTIKAPHKADICYATTNRQEVVQKIAPLCDLFWVVGARNSSNSRRLQEIAQQSGCPQSFLIDSVAGIDWEGVGRAEVLGLTAGASAPEPLVQEIIAACKDRFCVEVEEVGNPNEGVSFRMPRILERRLAS